MNKLDLQKVIREEVKKALKENSAPVITEAAATMSVSIPGAFISALKKFLSEAKQDADQGDTYYVMTPGKEKCINRSSIFQLDF